MEARPAPRVVDLSAWGALWGAAREWPRLLLGAGAYPPAARWHLRLIVGWLLLAFAVVLGLRHQTPTWDHLLPAAPAVSTSNQEPAADAPAAGTADRTDLTGLAHSNLFRPPVVRVRPKPSVIVPDLGNELQLHGVIGGDDPQAIIFHKRTQQIHSVRVGQTFGEFEVLEIQAMKVILKWRDETIELSM